VRRKRVKLSSFGAEEAFDERSRSLVHVQSQFDDRAVLRATDDSERADPHGDLFSQRSCTKYDNGHV
jgi:hypothetical protein